MLYKLGDLQTAQLIFRFTFIVLRYKAITFLCGKPVEMTDLSIVDNQN